MLADLKPGDQMDLDVMVNSYEIKFSERVKNNYFLAMTCKDSSGEIPVKVFDLQKDLLAITALYLSIDNINYRINRCS
jgi:hypothetical protein